MVNISTQSIVHHQTCGGLMPAEITTRKKKSVEYNNIDELQRNIIRPIAGLLCQSCISCKNRKCYFAFRAYPNCYLARV